MSEDQSPRVIDGAPELDQVATDRRVKPSGAESAPPLQSTSPLSNQTKATASDVEFFATWAETFDLLAERLAGMTFTPETLSVDESDLFRLGAQAGRALLEVVVHAGGGLAQPTMTGTLSQTSAGMNIEMQPDDPKLLAQWDERVPSPFLDVVYCWASQFRGLLPQGREIERLQQFWTWGGMVILAAQYPERFASVNPGARDFPRCEPTGRTDDGELKFTHETEQITLAERAAWRRSQARDWTEACRVIAGVVRKLADTANAQAGPPVSAFNVHQPAPDCESIPDSLQVIRANLELRESEGAAHADRTVRRQQLVTRFEDRLSDLTSFAGSSLSRDDRSRGDTFFADHARALLSFNEVLREFHREYPRYRILERLGRVSHASIPALETAASLLLLDPAANVNKLAVDLARFRGLRPNDVWAMWLAYILDQLMNSHRPPTTVLVPPDTTHDEWRQAERAFGCILFSEESFRVLQESMDHATCLIDDALKCGGHRVVNRPPGRVRDLIAFFDPRALHWYGSEFPPLPLLQPPPSIEAITEPVALRRQLDEVWTAANCLQMALDKWTAWFVELKEKEDAHPAVALNWCEMANRAVKVLMMHRPNVKPFDGSDESALLGMLPPIPAWWMPRSGVGPNAESAELIEKPRVRWQEDREFLDAYYWPPEQRQQKTIKLRGAAAQLIELLKSFPMAVLTPAREVGRHISQGDASPKADLVLVTVNQHETQAIHDAFREATGTEGSPVSLGGRLYHNLGVLNGTTVYHAISEMGSSGPGGMQQTVDKAIRALDPGAIIAVGIAFGVSEKDQSIGDILLSKQLRLYDLKRAGADIVLRGDKPHASNRLINHFEGFSQVKWKGTRVRPGVILSGETLIDNIDYRDQLLKLESEAVGGEMEGAGLYVSSHDHKVDWIVIKAICDWADGNKKRKKTQRQKKAARNAAHFLVQALQYATLKTH